MTKSGLLYYNIDTDRYEDIRIRKLKRACGVQGLAVYDYILCQIYRDKGYYIDWNEETMFFVSEWSGMRENKISEIISVCCSVGLFDAGVLASGCVLTSRSIQERYLRACKLLKRDRDADLRSAIKVEYLLPRPLAASFGDSSVGVSLLDSNGDATVKNDGGAGRSTHGNSQQLEVSFGDSLSAISGQNSLLSGQNSLLYGQNSLLSVQNSIKENKRKESVCETRVHTREQETSEPHTQRSFFDGSLSYDADGRRSKTAKATSLQIDAAPKVRGADIMQRQKAFAASVLKYRQTFDKELINDFIAYWTEPIQNSKEGQLRYEAQSAFDVYTRLKRWCKTEFPRNRKSGAYNGDNEVLSYEAYYKRYNTTEPKDGWEKRLNSAGNTEYYK